MSYQNIGTPIFYVDHLLWLKSLGELEYQAEPGWSGVSGSDMVSLNPSNYHKMFNKDVTPSGNYSYIEYPQAPKIGESIKNYVAVLGHNCHTAGASIHFVNLDGGQTDAYPLVNGSYGIPEYDGFSMYTNIDFGGHKFIRIHGLYQEAQADNHIGCYSHGNYYQMPHSPDLSLTLTRDYSGIKTIETKGGVSLSNRFYHKPPNWGTLGAWELRGGYMSDDPQYEDSFRSKLSRSGRRSFQLSWSFMDDRDLFGPNQMLTHHLIPGTTGLGSEDFGSPNLGSQRITNGNMEINNGTIANNWSIVGNGSYATEFTASIVTNGFSGDAQKITRSSGNTGFANIQQNSDIGFAGFHYGNTYKVSITHRNSGGVSIWAATPDVLIGNLTESTFSPITETFIFTPPNPNYTILQFFFVNLMSLAPGGGFIEFDNVSVRTLLDSDFQTNLLSDDNFFSQVYQKTLAGNIPMVMQIDKDNFNADQFAIVRIKSDTLKATQTAPGLYDISLSLEEVW